MKIENPDQTVSAEEEDRTRRTAETGPVLTPQQKLREFCIGFLCGFIFSVYSFHLLPLMEHKRLKRIGMFWGCFLSFLVILFVCFSFAAYTSYKHEIRERNKALVRRQGRKLVLRSYSEFLAGSPDKFQSVRVTHIHKQPKPVRVSKARRQSLSRHRGSGKPGKNGYNIRRRTKKQHNIV
jgi:hypothetical protein